MKSTHSAMQYINILMLGNTKSLLCNVVHVNVCHVGNSRQVLNQIAFVFLRKYSALPFYAFLRGYLTSSDATLYWARVDLPVYIAH